MKTKKALKVIIRQLEGEIVDHGNLYTEDKLEELKTTLGWAKRKLEEKKAKKKP